MTLPAGADGDRIFEAALARGIAYSRGDLFFVDGGGGESLSLSFTTLPPDRIAEGVEALAAVVRASRRPRAIRMAAPRARAVAAAARGGR